MFFLLMVPGVMKKVYWLRAGPIKKIVSIILTIFLKSGLQTQSIYLPPLTAAEVEEVNISHIGFLSEKLLSSVPLCL